MNITVAFFFSFHFFSCFWKKFPLFYVRLLIGYTLYLFQFHVFAFCVFAFEFDEMPKFFRMFMLLHEFFGVFYFSIEKSVVCLYKMKSTENLLSFHKKTFVFSSVHSFVSFVISLRVKKMIHNCNRFSITSSCIVCIVFDKQKIAKKNAIF